MCARLGRLLRQPNMHEGKRGEQRRRWREREKGGEREREVDEERRSGKRPYTREGVYECASLSGWTEKYVKAING